MKFTPLVLQGSYEIVLSPFTDDRGWFVRTYSTDEFEKIGFAGEWVQMNHSCTTAKGAIRGMHFQLPPFRETKLVRCVRGEVFDVIVDIREGSATFLQWTAVTLSASKFNMIYIPEGFAHGFQTLNENCELVYLHSNTYQPEYEGGIRYNDERLNIEWPMEAKNLSERDKNHQLLTNTFKGI